MSTAIVDTRPPAMPTASIVSKVLHCHTAAYCSAVVGVLVATLSDYTKNQPNSVVDKLGSGIFAATGFGHLLAFLLLILTGSMVCWIYEPRNRVDGFMRGVSALGLLTIVAPHPVDKPLKADQATDPARPPVTARMATSVAYAGTAWAKPTTSTVVVRLLVGDASAPFEALITLRDAGSGATVARQRVRTSEFEVAQPNGRYVLEVEADGYRRTQTMIDIGLGEAPVYEVALDPSSVPVGVQRFYPADTVAPSSAGGARPTE